MTQYSYDAAHPPTDLLCESGAVFINCYTDGDYAYAPSIIKRFVDAGMGILANHENVTSELTGGTSAGIAAAVKAMTAVNLWPVKPPAIYFSVDMYLDPASKEYAAVLQAFMGIRQQMAGQYLTGCYGEGDLIRDLAARGLTQVHGWLPASSGWPGWDPTSPFVGQYQLLESDIPGTDLNQITNLSGMGVWLPPVPPDPPRETAVKFIVTYANGQWVVDPNLTSRVHITDNTDVLLGTGQYVEVVLSYAQMAAIPVVTAVALPPTT